MGKKAIKCMALALSASVLAQRQPVLAMASPMEVATSSSASRQTINTVKTGAVKSGAVKSGSRKDIIQITMPVAEENIFDFIMDPQELIGKTDAAAYGGKRFEADATLFFRRSDDEAGNDYSSSSDALTILNRGDTDVDVVLKASIDPDSIVGITLSDDPEFSDHTDASLYLALTDGETIVPIDSEKGAVIEAEIYGISEGEEPNEYSFRLIGAVNKNGDWSEVTDVSPEVTVTWKVTMDGGDWMEETEAEAEESLASAKRDETVETPEESVPVESPGTDGKDEEPTEGSGSTEESEGQPESPGSAGESEEQPESPGSTEESEGQPESSGSTEESKGQPESPGSTEKSEGQPESSGSTEESEASSENPGSVEESESSPESPGSTGESEALPESPGSGSVEEGEGLPEGSGSTEESEAPAEGFGNAGESEASAEGAGNAEESEASAEGSDSAKGSDASPKSSGSAEENEAPVDSSGSTGESKAPLEGSSNVKEKETPKEGSDDLGKRKMPEENTSASAGDSDDAGKSVTPEKGEVPRKSSDGDGSEENEALKKR